MGVSWAGPATEGHARDLASPVPAVRREAAKALGFLKDPRAVPPLLKALSDSDLNVRFYAAYALGEIKDARAATALLQALRDPEYCVRDQAAWALRELHDPSLAPRLEAALKEKDADRAHIEWLLGRSGPSPATPPPPPRQDGLAAHWSFDDGNPKVAKDSVGPTHGEIKGCQPVKGRVGHALQFTKGGYVELHKPPALPVADVPFTIMAWAKSDAKSGVVVARGGAFCGFSLYLKDGVAKFGIHRVQDGPAFIAAGRESVVVGQWVHLAGVVRQDRIELFVNGKLAATAKTDGYLPSDCGQGMEIGFDVANSPAEITDAFEGVIDEVKFYRIALSEPEIAKQCHPTE